MITRSFSNIREKPTLLGFGCMRLPTLDEDKKIIDEEKATQLLHYAHAQGITYFDVAYPYLDQKCEAFVAKALSPFPRSSYYLADKMPVWLIKQETDTNRLFQEQLERCQTSYFDFYLAHSMDREKYEIFEKFHVYDYLAEQKKQGKIHNLGFSFHDSPQLLQTMLEKYSWDFVQIQLNYLDWELQNAKEQYELIRSHGIPCVIMEPVRGGTLASLCDEANALLHRFHPDASTASWALRFAASLPNVMTVLSGMTTMEQLQDNLNTIANFQPLTEQERDVLAQALAAYRANPTIPCTGCRYCMPCPAGVDIPKMFQLYNQYSLDHKELHFNISYWQVDPSKHADKCVNCKKCMKICPQGIAIPEHMAEIKALMDKILEKEKEKK